MAMSKLRFRKVVLLTAVASFVSFLNYVIALSPLLRLQWQSYGNLTFDLLTGLVFSLFFFVLYCEASERIKARARTITAITLSTLLVLRAGGKLFQLAFGIFTLRHYHIGYSSDFLAEVFYLLETIVWIAFLIAFSKNRVTPTTRLIPTLAGVLALLTLGFAIWNTLQLYHGYEGSPRLVSWTYLILLFHWLALLFFFVAIWRGWKRDLPIQQNVVC